MMDVRSSKCKIFKRERESSQRKEKVPKIRKDKLKKGQRKESGVHGICA